MARDHWPFFKFYPSDWTQDTQILSLEAQGAWMKIICAMWIAPARGLITFKKRDLCVFLANASDEEAEQITVDLDNVADICWRDVDDNIAASWKNTFEITFTCRRMVREEAERKQGLEADRRYREKKTSTKRPKNVGKTSDRSQKSEDIYQKTEEEDKKPQAALFILPDWVPKEAWEEYVAVRKRKRAPLTDKIAERVVRVLATLRDLGHAPAAVLAKAVDRNWTSIEVDWIAKPNGHATGVYTPEPKPIRRREDMPKDEPHDPKVEAMLKGLIKGMD